MFLRTFHQPGLSINTYFIGDTATKRALLIDPTRDVELYIQCAKEEGFIITDIAETHVHADFLSGSKELKQSLEQKPTIHCSAMGGKEWTPLYADKHVLNGDRIQLGTITLQALHTPGHTPEHIIWICFDESRSKQIPCLAFTGDLLFVGSIGRPDLLGEEQMKILAQQLYNTLFVELATLPEFLEIYPAHGAGSLCGKGLSARPSSTLGYERMFNPFLTKKPFDQWIVELQRDIPAPPLNFRRLKKVNVQGPSIQMSTTTPSETEFILIDVRTPELYAKSHIKDSLNIPFGNPFCNWVGSVIAEDLPLVVIASNHHELVETIHNLHLIGFDQIAQQWVWDDHHMDNALMIESLPLLNVETLAENIRTNCSSSYVLDVRTSAEWKGGHINGAHHIELPFLLENIDKIPHDSSIYVVCGGGYRASIGASLLKKQGFANVANIRGGMAAWNKAKLPIVNYS